VENHGKPMVPRKIIYKLSLQILGFLPIYGKICWRDKHHPSLKHPLSLIAPLNAKKHI